MCISYIVGLVSQLVLVIHLIRDVSKQSISKRHLF
jgi:hypothetical protein